MDPLTGDQIEAIQIQIYIIMSIYVGTFLFAAFNIYHFLILQKRYKNVLISIFYFLTLAVIVLRICNYAFYYDLLGSQKTLFNDENAWLSQLKAQQGAIQELQDFLVVLQNQSQNWIIALYAATYSKTALGAYQLAALAELAISVRNSILWLKHF